MVQTPTPQKEAPLDALKSAYVSISGSPYGQYVVAAAALVALVLSFTLVKRIALRQLKALAARTPNDFDDFLVGLAGQIGAPLFILVALFIVTAPLSLAPAARQFVRSALVLGLTVQAVLIGHSVIRYGVRKFYQRARPGDPTTDAMTKTFSGVLGSAL
jgi:hypothetical protein